MRLLVFLLLLALSAAAQPQHGVRPTRMIIQGATVVEGTGTPAQGPLDITIENGLITQIARGAQPRPGDTIVDARGKYVIPGLINMHGHLHQERGGVPMDPNYVLKLWLACGITTVRDVGSALQFTLDAKAKSERGEIAAPRLFVYPMLGRPGTPEAAVNRVKELKARGADGMKIVGAWRNTFDAAAREAKAASLPIAIHIGVEETNATDAIRNQVATIEHWYGIPDAALPAGVQNFPSSYNYLNEADRFRYAGRLWREADPQKLGAVLDAMVAQGVAWDPTLEIYEASRDLQRAQNQPWFRDYLHPALGSFFTPNLENHGSYFINWSSTDEAFWKENYRLWFAAVRDFEARGGTLTMGEDAGYIYQMYGFGMLRNLELHQEAGFHPLRVLRHATVNGARVLRAENTIGRVRAGWSADLLIVNGNPLEDFKVLYPVSPNAGTRTGIEWTIKAGFPYHVPRLLSEVKSLVEQARKP
ncbi:MAG: amidohydrolase family protein [Acidobacteria bacterium]|nr:amidohydrolase family protein [Acidobacteriota bacterium]